MKYNKSYIINQIICKICYLYKVTETFLFRSGCFRLILRKNINITVIISELILFLGLGNLQFSNLPSIKTLYLIEVLGK